MYKKELNLRNVATILACLVLTTVFLSCKKKESSDKQITAFGFTMPPAVGVIDEDAKTIIVEVPFGINITALVPTIAISNGATVNPTSGEPQDFTNPVTYTVRAEDGSSVNYIVTVEQSGYCYNGNSFKIAWAGYFYDDLDGGYCFGISPTVPTGKLFNEPNFFEVDYPASKLGKKCDLSQNNYDGFWYLYGYFNSNGTKYFFEDNNSGADDVTGSNNWVKVTYNLTQNDNYTIEFSMTIGGKLLEGKYSGQFQRKTNYHDIGN